ncbi:hypothetical protein HSIVP1_1208 [Veillonella parvula HSIVP1]|nr:type I restriction enzyme HsdR N-terminal domain-containing protein [Veillonella parvula]EQC67321.1 hypothetical protein HSIVP1_1208 [Veillonella parvula HSIVP1]
MKYIEEIFDKIELEKLQRDGDCIYDPIRCFLLAATPEECVRQKTIVFLQQELGIPINRIFVEESMAHTKKGLRGRADIVVYRDDECTDVLMIIECKAPHINVLGDEVFNQASGYREILSADYIMLVNGVEAIIYYYNDGAYHEVKDIPLLEELLIKEISFVEPEPFEAYKYEELMSDEFQEAFAEHGDISEYTPKYIRGVALNLINLILHKEIKKNDVLKNIGVSEDCYVSMPHFGNRSGSTQLNISIANKESRHHSLQLNLDRYCRYNPITNIVDIVHNGSLTRGKGGAAKRADVIAYIKERAPELVHGDEIFLGCLNNSRLLEWSDPNVQSFIRNLLRYAVLRDGFRAEYKKSK